MIHIRIICISDTHSQHENLTIPDGDILIHSGDATYKGTPFEIMKFGLWFCSLPHKMKIFVSGNHDWMMQRQERDALEHLSGCIYLKDSSVEVDGFKIWGSPWQPFFYDWAFNLQRGEEIQKKWDLIPVETNILITHGPPFEILDKNLEGEHCGCQNLRDTIFSRLKNLKLHVFGHIHEGYGQTEVNGIKFVNASICTRAYKPTNPPIVIDL